ncbi:MAG: lauroyl acyltransferase, partial [Pedobacter sp.]
LTYYPLFYIFKYRRKVVAGNLRNAFPERSAGELLAIEKRFYRHLTDVMFETIKSYSISEKELLKRLAFKGTELVDKYYEEGKNVIFCTGHYCNWEMIALGLGLKNRSQMVVIYKPISNKLFENWFTRLRTRFGAIFVPMRQTLRALSEFKERAAFCFACDQSPVKEEAKYFVNFLKQPTAALLGIEKVARRTNYPVFYFKTTRVRRGYYTAECIPLAMEPATTAPFEITNLHLAILEETINKEPAYWLWSHNRWKHKPLN